MSIILADAIFRTLEHKLKDFHRGGIVEVQILSLQYNLNEQKPLKKCTQCTFNLDILIQ